MLRKTYNQLHIDQLSRCSVRIRHNNKCVNCSFSVVPSNGPTLLWMPGIELLGVIRVMCTKIDNKTNDRKFHHIPPKSININITEVETEPIQPSNPDVEWPEFGPRLDPNSADFDFQKELNITIQTKYREGSQYDVGRTEPFH